MTSQRLLKGRPQGKALLTQRRKIATNAAKRGKPLLGAKTAGDFLLDLEHAQIAFCLIVAERHGEIDQERQHLPFVLQKPIQQIARRMLFGMSPVHFLDGSRGRIGLIARRQDPVHNGDESVPAPERPVLVSPKGGPSPLPLSSPAASLSSA